MSLELLNIKNLSYDFCIFCDNNDYDCFKYDDFYIYFTINIYKTDLYPIMLNHFLPNHKRKSLNILCEYLHELFEDYMCENELSQNDTAYYSSDEN